ncbi:MAG: TetR/AcrR family transcriptional regulator [Propionibacteriaceae bacterium]|nr:TetR/AcrR family transcriptional regulator [Propionibacteriaceae bacterium]
MRESRKTRYTRLALRQALIETLRNKPITAVTVAELCRGADLSRGTFYLHYASPAELLEEVEDELFDRFTAPLRGAEAVDDHTFGLVVLRELAADPDAAQLVLQPGSRLVERFFAFKRSRLERACRERYPDLDDRQLDYVRAFFEQGVVHLIAAWVGRGMAEPPAQMAALLARLT